MTPATTLTQATTAPAGVQGITGYAPSYVIDADGYVRAVGYGEEGALGNGTTVSTSSYTAQLIQVLAGPTTEGDLTSLASAYSTLSPLSYGPDYADTGTALNTISNDTFFNLFAVAIAGSAASTTSNTTAGLSSSGVVNSTLSFSISELVSAVASASDSALVSSVARLFDVGMVTGVFSNQTHAVHTITQLIVALDLYESGKLQDLSDSAISSSTISGLLRATQLVVESAVGGNSTSSYLLITQTAGDDAATSEVFSLNTLASALLSDSATGFAHFVINGEVYTGWVMNTQNSAVTEYQGMNFNSLAKIGTKYYGATDEGVYELAGDASDVSTYIQSGLLDFGSTQYKAVTTAYLGVDVDGRIAVGVGVSEKSGVAQHWYEVTMDKEATDNVKVPIGRGLKGRYWKFEVASESMATFEALTVLPVVLTRKV
jgi:hypothetical protein